MPMFSVSNPIVVGEYDKETNTYKNVKKLEDMVKPRPIKAETEVETNLDEFMEKFCKEAYSRLKRTDRFRHLLDNEKTLLLVSRITDIVKDIFDISPDADIKMYIFQNDDGLSIHIGNENSIFIAKVAEIFRKTQCLKPEKEYK